jgi:hypothetical protein
VPGLSACHHPSYAKRAKATLFRYVHAKKAGSFLSFQHYDFRAIERQWHMMRSSRAAPWIPAQLQLLK